jgi:hypothetical protein
MMIDGHTTTHFVLSPSDEEDQLALKVWFTKLLSFHPMNKKNMRMLPCHVASTFVVPFAMGS